MPPLKIHPKDAATIWNREWRIQTLYGIRTEDRKLRRMRFRPVQRALFDRMAGQRFRGVRLFDLKSRKHGVTTFFELLYLDDTLFTPNTTSAIVAHRREDLHKLFKIVRLAYRTAPARVRLADGRLWVKPTADYDNANELSFPEINSRIYVALETRGDTNNNVHVSEAAFIKDAENRMAATLESVPKRETGSNITIESTANGMGGWFHEGWSDAENGLTDFDAVFFGWWQNPSNRAPAPRGYKPGAEAADLARRIRERYGVTADKDMLFWWERKKAERKRLMEQEHPTFPEDAFLTSDAMVFDGEIVRRLPVRPPRRIWKKVRIWQEPIPGRRYVLGADVAEGVGGDSSAIVVVDAVTLEQVAEYDSDTIPPARFALTIARVAAHYNRALAAVERNNHGHLVLDRLKDVYGNIFVKTTFDEKVAKRTKKLGWETTGHTRDLMLDELVDGVESGAVKVRSGKLQGEMFTFVTNEDGKREAKEGKKDDLVMAAAIAVKVARMPKASFAVYNLA